MRLDKPIGIWLLMWPMLWSMWVSTDGQVNETLLIIFLFGVIIMRSAGCVLNDIADKNIDLFVKRTKDRPIASGKVSVREGKKLFLLLMAIACSLLFFLNSELGKPKVIKKYNELKDTENIYDLTYPYINDILISKNKMLSPRSNQILAKKIYKEIFN